MNNMLLIMLVLIGAALALLLGLIALQSARPALPGEPCVYKKSALDSIEIPGFELETYFEADGIFEGEKNSRTTSCVPARDSEDKQEIERIGITEFNLESRDAGPEIIRTFTSFVAENQIRTLDLFEKQVRMTEFRNSRSASFFWQDNLQVFYIEVTGDYDAIDPEVDDAETIEVFMAKLRQCGLATVNAILGDR